MSYSKTPLANPKGAERGRLNVNRVGFAKDANSVDDADNASSSGGNGVYGQAKGLKNGFDNIRRDYPVTPTNDYKSTYVQPCPTSKSLLRRRAF